GIDHSGASSLTLSGIQAYTGATTISGGSTLFLTGAGSIATSSGLAITSGTFDIAGGAGDKTIGALTGSGAITLGANTLNIASGSYGGIISGTGGIDHTGASSLTLTGINAYTGATTISGGATLFLSGAGSIATSSGLAITSGTFDIAAGTGDKTIGVLTGVGTITLGANTLNIASGSYGGAIGGTGGITKSTAGILTLTAANGYTGTTTITGGGTLALSGAASTLGASSPLSITSGTFDISAGAGGKTIGPLSGGGIITLGANTLTIPSGSYSGAIGGTGGITKSTGGTLTLSGTSTYSGATLISGGVLNLAGGDIGSSFVTISGGTSLTGDGTVGGVSNSSSIAPGASIGTIVISGSFTQTAGGTYDVEIEPGGGNDFLDISGTATLAGTLALDPLPGIYSAGTSFLVLEADGGLGGTQFDFFVESHPLDFEVVYTGTTVTILLPGGVIVFEGVIDGSDLKGNAKKIFDYIFCDDVSFIPPGRDLMDVTTVLAQLATEEFTKALIHMTPQQFKGLALTGQQNSMRVANAMLSRLNSFDYEWSQRCHQRAGNSVPHDMWVMPLGYYYNQNEREDQFGFDVRTYGVNVGTSLLFFDHLVLGMGLNYLYSDLHWAEDGGRANFDTISLTPTIGYISENFFINFLSLGGRTFYDVDRRIAFSSIKRIAHNDHKSWDLEQVLSGGYKYKLPRWVPMDLYLQPEVTLTYQNIIESGYQESGAKSLNLSVRNKTSSFFTSRIDLRLIEAIEIENSCIISSFRVGWLRYIPTTNGDYTSRLYKQATCEKNFTIETMDKTTDQLVVGVDLQASPDENLTFQISYEAAFGDHTSIQQGSARFQWDF
ncbi:MAG: hypothetical protein K1060chlam2_00784, partial [Chlamydiae bacterium]|nr:hypothetical protein [Chlamydiota bacterium]